MPAHEDTGLLRDRGSGGDARMSKGDAAAGRCCGGRAAGARGAAGEGGSTVDDDLLREALDSDAAAAVKPHLQRLAASLFGPVGLQQVQHL